MNSLCWIESFGSGPFGSVPKFLPLPKGEGRGEGEGHENLFTREWILVVSNQSSAALQ